MRNCDAMGSREEARLYTSSKRRHNKTRERLEQMEQEVVELIEHLALTRSQLQVAMKQLVDTQKQLIDVHLDRAYGVEDGVEDYTDTSFYAPMW